MLNLCKSMKQFGYDITNGSVSCLFVMINFIENT